MRQQPASNVGETDDLYPLSIQKSAGPNGEHWFIYDLRHGGKVSIPFDTYKAAEIVAREWYQLDADRIKALFEAQRV